MPKVKNKENLIAILHKFLRTMTFQTFHESLRYKETVFTLGTRNFEFAQKLVDFFIISSRDLKHIFFGNKI